MYKIVNFPPAEWCKAELHGTSHKSQVLPYVSTSLSTPPTKTGGTNYKLQIMLLSTYSYSIKVTYLYHYNGMSQKLGVRKKNYHDAKETADIMNDYIIQTQLAMPD